MAHINKLHYKENLKNVKSDVIAKGIFEDDKKLNFAIICDQLFFHP